MEDDVRPEWKFKLTEEQVRKLTHTIISISHHSKLTSVDSSRDWISFHTGNCSFVAPDGWDQLFEFKPYWAGLITPNYKGKEAIKVLREIDRWEKENHAERAELERLKVKFGQ